MGAPHLHLVRAEGYAQARILTYAEVRVELGLTEPGLEWLVTAPSGKSCRVFADRKPEAVRLGAIELGVLPEVAIVEPVQSERLMGSGQA